MFYGSPNLRPKSEKDDLKGRTIILVGRKGLCEKNGVFQKHNIDSVEMLVQVNLKDDPKFNFEGK